MLDLGLFTLASREEHVSILAVHSTEGLLLIRILVGYIIWQKTAKERESEPLDRRQRDALVNITSRHTFSQKTKGGGTNTATFVTPLN